LESKRKRIGKPKPALIIGHRGASGVAPENTLAAFLMAIALGADGVEMDVQLSADGEPVVIHDKRVDRTANGVGYVSGFTSAQLASLDAGWRFTVRLETRPRLRARVQRLAGGPGGSAFSSIPQPIPRLESVLELLSPTGLSRIYVEIKGSESTRPVLLERTLSCIRRLGLEDVVTLLSFDHAIVRCAKQVAPAVRTAITIPGLANRLPTTRSIIRAAEAAGADEVALHYSIASPRLVRALHQRGLQVSAWTANRKILMRRLLALGVDSIMTNHVDRLKSVIQA
jgi:glycerophosphoryl diester phosphodiesterase